MILSLVASSSRLAPLAVSSVRPAIRTFTASSSARAKQPLRPSEHAAEPMDLLTLIGRGADKALAEHAKTWDSLTDVWMKGGEKMKDIAGLSVKDRRYVMSCFCKYSQGQPPWVWVKTVKTKKFRAWGTKIQKGVRVRGVDVKSYAG